MPEGAVYGECVCLIVNYNHARLTIGAEINSESTAGALDTGLHPDGD